MAEFTAETQRHKEYFSAPLRLCGEEFATSRASSPAREGLRPDAPHPTATATVFFTTLPVPFPTVSSSV